MNSEHWTNDEEILARARRSNIIFIYGEQAEDRGIYDETEYREIMQIFHAEHAPTSYERPGDYSAAFKNWFSQHGYIYHALRGGGTVSISRQWTLPDGGTISISCGGNFRVSNTGSLDRITDGLVNMLESQYSRLLGKQYGGYEPPKNQPRIVQQTTSPQQLAHGQKTVKIDHIDTLYQDGRKMVRAYGEPYMRHGIPIFDSTLKALGLTEAELKVAEKIPVNRTAIVDMNLEKNLPRRVAGWWD